MRLRQLADVLVVGEQDDLGADDLGVDLFETRAVKPQPVDVNTLERVGDNEGDDQRHAEDDPLIYATEVAEVERRAMQRRPPGDGGQITSFRRQSGSDENL